MDKGKDQLLNEFKDMYFSAEPAAREGLCLLARLLAEVVNSDDLGEQPVLSESA